MYTQGQSVFVKAKVGGSEIAFPATVTSVNEPDAKGKGQRTAYTITPDGGKGSATVASANLFPA